MLTNDLMPTRSALLQLSEEHDVVLEAYDFLDEKRLLLAAELLRQLKRYEDLLAEYEALRMRAEQALLKTLQRHGLQGAQVYPGDYVENSELRVERKPFMGVTLLETQLIFPQDTSPATAANPSPEANFCQQIFRELILTSGVIAGVSGNLYRLFAEYRRTERRARALENVVIPEIQQTLQTMATQLEELDQEDVIRVHLHCSEA